MSPFRLIFLSAPFISLGLYYFYITEAYMALIHALNGDILEASRARSEATNALTRHSGLYSLPFIYIFPALGLISFIEYFKRLKSGCPKNNIFLLCGVIIFFTMSAMYSILLIQKYYLVQLVIYIFICFSIVKEYNINYFKLFLCFIIAVLAISALWVFYVGSTLEDSVQAPVWVLERIFSANLNGLKYYIDYYNNNPLLLGYSFPNPLHIFPYEPVSLTKIISREYIMTPGQISAGLVGSHPTIYLGEMLVNFGYLGCIVSSVFIGIVLGSINRLLSFVVKKTPTASSFSIVTYTILAVNSLEMATGSVFIFLSHIFVINEFLWVTLIILFMLNIIVYKKPVKLGESN